MPADRSPSPDPSLDSSLDKGLRQHVRALRRCRRCPAMHPPPVSGGAVVSRVMLVGQAPGDKEPKLGRPFAWTAGKTLFRWFEQACGLDEQAFRSRVYMAAVCRCFPGKRAGGGDRVPDAEEIERCATWLDAEMDLLRPELIIPVGRLAIAQFMTYESLQAHISQSYRLTRGRHTFDAIPLPHPSGASPWPRMEPGKTLLQRALQSIAEHPAMLALVRYPPS